MNAPVNELVRLAEEHGAVFKQMPTGTWTAFHRSNYSPATWGASRVDAAVRFLDEIRVEPTEPAAILAAIRHSFRPYDTLPEFQRGFDSYQKVGALREHPYDNGPDGGGVKAQAFDRGANAAMLYARALAFPDEHKRDVEKAGPGWLARLLRTGRS